MTHTRPVWLLPLLLMAQTATAQTEPAMDAKGWNLDTTPQSQTEATAESPPVMNMRVYRNFDGHNHHGENTPYAVDVSAVMTRCSDGSLIVTALVIGGQLTPLDNRCPATRK